MTMPAVPGAGNDHLRDTNAGIIGRRCIGLQHIRHEGHKALIIQLEQWTEEWCNGRRLIRTMDALPATVGTIPCGRLCGTEADMTNCTLNVVN